MVEVRGVEPPIRDCLLADHAREFRIGRVGHEINGRFVVTARDHRRVRAGNFVVPPVGEIPSVGNGTTPPSQRRAIIGALSLGLAASAARDSRPRERQGELHQRLRGQMVLQPLDELARDVRIGA
jgi:hypothetical protein